MQNRVTKNALASAAQTGDEATVDRYIRENKGNPAIAHNLALDWSISKGHTNIAIKLLNEGLDTNSLTSTTKDGSYTHLMFAASFNNMLVLAAILPKLNHILDLSYTNDKGNSAESLAKGVNIELIKKRKEELVALSSKRLSDLLQKFQMRKFLAFTDFRFDEIKKDVKYFKTADPGKFNLDDIMIQFEGYTQCHQAAALGSNITITGNVGIAILAFALQQPSPNKKPYSLNAITLCNASAKNHITDVVWIFRHTTHLNIHLDGSFQDASLLFDNLMEAKTHAGEDFLIKSVSIKTPTLDSNSIAKLTGFLVNNVALVKITINKEGCYIEINENNPQDNASSLTIESFHHHSAADINQLMQLLPQSAKKCIQISGGGYVEGIEIATASVVSFELTNVKLFRVTIKNIRENLLKKVTQVKYLRLESLEYPVGVDSKAAFLKELIELILTMPNLEKLSLNDCGLTDQELEIIISLFSINKNMTELNLQNNNFTNAGLEKFVEKLLQVVSLDKLVLDSVHIDKFRKTAEKKKQLDEVQQLLPTLEQMITDYENTPESSKLVKISETLLIAENAVATLVTTSHANVETVTQIKTRVDNITQQVSILKMQNLCQEMASDTNELPDYIDTIKPLLAAQLKAAANKYANELVRKQWETRTPPNITKEGTELVDLRAPLLRSTQP